MSDSVLRPLGPGDVDDVVALNDRFVHLTAPMPHERVREMAETGTVEVIVHGGRFAGFVITAMSGSGFASENFDWFAGHYDDYCYLDRIIVHEDVRRAGLGRRVYDEIEARAARAVPVLTLEVNIDPPNEPSLAFHAGRGFEQVGERFITDHTVGMMAKRLA
ncbi:hypothetical protein GCM10009623_10580 [Nocardioides aestuarii]|uniref:GNAT family N-acetyltransferase n=1 Tax=Nocardioides aestuarii TaxID=252231 RepID=A0ABW4TJS5_9ACTN